MKKSEEVEFVSKKLKLLSVTELKEYLKEAPLKEKERKIIIGIVHGYSLNELAEQMGVSMGRISQMKREVYKKLYDWENKETVSTLIKPNDENKNYLANKIRILATSEFEKYIEDSPLNNNEKNISLDVARGKSNKEMAEKYNLSESYISKKRAEISLKLYEFDKRQIVIPVQQDKQINIEEIINKKVQEAFIAKEAELKQKEVLLDKYIEKETKIKIDKKLQQIKKSQNLNTRGTKRAVPQIILDKQIQNDIVEMSVVDLKKKYIPMYARKEISTKEFCNIFGHTIDWACRIRKKYLVEGENFSFENGHKGKSPNNKVNEEIRNRILKLYNTEYNQFSLSDFTKILNEKYEIKLSKVTISKILKENGVKTPTSDKFLGQSKETLGNDYFEVMELFHSSVKKEDFSDIEEYGLVQICELSFLKAYSALNSISKKKFKLKFRTTYSLFEYFVDNAYINVKDAWSYWNGNHDKFSYIYNKPTRYKVIQDIKKIYYPMFVSIEEYIRQMKEELE